MVATKNTFGQNGAPKFVEPLPQVYTSGQTITPLLPQYRNGSSLVPATVFGQVTTLVPQASFNSPQDIQIGPDGNFYVADAGNHVIRQITRAGVVSIYAGTGASGHADEQRNAAKFVSPARIAFDAAGNMFITDSEDQTWKVNGISVNTNTAEFSSNTLVTGDKITCTVTNTDGVTPGGTPASATSNVATLLTQSSFTNTVSISSSYTGPICPGTSITFTANANVSTSSNIKYEWQVNGQNTNVNSTTYTSSTLMNGDVVTCSITSDGKCVLNPVILSNAITMAVWTEAECEIVRYNTFTPNNDGIDDTWNIPALAYYPNCSVLIYARNGRLVFQSTGYAKVWDGNYNGSPLPASTYYYIIDTKIGKQPIAGSITILK